MKRCLVIPDCHFPFVDQRAYDLMLKAAVGVIKPDEIVILGDYADFYDVNAHGKDAALTGVRMKDEIASVVEALGTLRGLFPAAKIVYLEGNHEYRLERFISSKCHELFGLIKLPDLLELSSMNIEWVPYGPRQKYNVLGSKLIARHEPIGSGVHCAHSTVVKANHSVIFGHVHRIQESQIVTIEGEEFRGIASGWLGDKNHRVFNYVKSHHQWNLGFSVVTVLENGHWFNQLIHIIDYKCMVDGFLYKN